MIIKQCQFRGQDDQGVHVHLIHPGHDNDHLVKTAAASPPQLEKVLKLVRGMPKSNGHLPVMVSAMGAGEYWGSNCLPTGTPVLMADGSELPIEAVSVGDRVLSHLGVSREVSRTFKHEAEGLVCVRPQGHPRYLRTTSGHPYFAVPRDEVVRQRRKIVFKRDKSISLSEAKAAFLDALKPDWIEAGDLKKGDLVYLYVDDHVQIHEELNESDMPFVLGLYAAEGCIGRRRRKDRKGHPWQDHMVIFTLGGHEGHKADRLIDALSSRNLSPKRTDDYQGYYTIRVEVCSQRLARICRDHVGKLSKHKALSTDVMRMPREWQINFLASYFGGDACLRGPGKGEGSVRVSTASEQLALDVRMMLARIGVVASVIPGEQHYTSLGAGNPIFEISVPNGQIEGDRSSSESMRRGNYLICPVKDVVEDEQWHGSVFNLEVEVENSYVADRVVLHNSNGDYFPEASLIHTPPNWNGMSLDLQRQLGAKWEWGYPTFYNAHAFQHHVNKDPARAFGDVIFSMWDPQMKRVILVINIDRARARQMGAIGVVDRIENGEFPDVSMGCKVPYDVCSICADWSRITQNPKVDLREHKQRPIRGLSTTRHEYCQHLQAELNKIYPDGRKVAMLNLHPKFFDISFVFIGADKTSKVMAKLAGKQPCPIRSDSPMCKKGCYSCAIPSSHVYEVWSKNERAAEKEKTAQDPPVVKYWDGVDAEGNRVGGVIVRGTKEWDDFHSGVKSSGRTLFRGSAATKRSMPKESATFPGLERALAEEEKLASAFGIDKQSAEEIAKKAEIIKQIRSNFSKNLPGMTSTEQDIPNDVLARMAQCPSEALGTAGSLGIVLKPREFQRTIIISRGRPDLADDLDRACSCFKPGAAPSRDFSLSNMIIPKILEALAPLIGARSSFGPPLHRRVIKMTIVRPKPITELEGNPLLDKLSADYSAYRQQLLYKQASLLNQLLHEHSWVIPEIAGIEIEGSFGGGLVKAGGSVMESVVGMLTIDYLNRAHLSEPISEFVQDHCDLEGLRSAGELASCGRVA